MTWRGAIIGAGNVALHAHLPGWLARSDVAIVAGADERTAARADLVSRVPAVRWYDSAQELLARESLDFVDICTPPSTHAPLIHAALERGAHVLCEKPLVCSLEDLAAVAEHASAATRVLHTVHNWHHAPIVERAATLLRDGAIGRVRRVRWHTLRTQPAAIADARRANWRVDPEIAGGGVLTDHGWHVFYVVCAWLGAAPTSVSARLETRRHTVFAVEDTATIELAFADATAEIFLTWAADERRTWAEIDGEFGTMRLEDDTLVLTSRGADERRFACPPALSAGSQHPEWFHPVAERFVHAIDGTPVREGSLDEASLCVALEALARESSRCAGRPQTLASARPTALVPES